MISKEIYLINKEYFMAIQFQAQDPFAEMKLCLRSHPSLIR